MTVLERETEQLVDALAQRTIAQSRTISLREILASDALPAVRSFFRADVEAMLLEEYRAAVKQSRFNHDHPDVKHAQAQLDSALVMHYSFGRKEFLSRLTDAVHLLANFLVRPQWTLAGVVFEKEPAISIESLRRLLGYFAPYAYLRDVILRYAADRKLSAFTREEFTLLLWKIDGAFVRRKSGQELCDLLSPLYAFFDYPKNGGDNAVPMRALIKFFEDKGLTEVQTRLEGEMAQGLQEVTLAALAPILEDVRRTAGEFTVERTEQKAAEPSPDGAAVGADARTAAERAGPDIAGAIQEGEKRKFIRKIFRQEDSKYEEAVRELSGMPGWKEASRHIDEIFIRNDVDPYSSEAERFIEIVFQQFHPSR